MKTLKLAIGLLSIVAPLSASAFPVGKYRCTSDDFINVIEISSLTFASSAQSFPSVKAAIARGRIKSTLIGIGTVVSIFDPATNKTEFWLKLPGTNFQLKFDERTNEPTSSKCVRE